MKYAEREWRGKAYQTRMKALCEGLGELGLWTRLHYVYPYPHVDEIIPLMADGKILPYLDIPFQHASPRVLKLMKRPGAVDKTLERIRRWRDVAPDITIRSTFIVGFPGETEAEFEELLDFLDEAQLDRVGAFAYSPVDGAKANDLPDPLPEDVKQDRLARFMERQAEISTAKLEAKIGSVQRCLVDAIDGDLAIARSMADAPEIDGLVQIQNGREAGLKPGDFAIGDDHGQRRARPLRRGRPRLTADGEDPDAAIAAALHLPHRMTRTSGRSPRSTLRTGGVPCRLRQPVHPSMRPHQRATNGARCCAIAGRCG